MRQRKSRKESGRRRRRRRRDRAILALRPLPRCVYSSARRSSCEKDDVRLEDLAASHAGHVRGHNARPSPSGRRSSGLVAERIREESEGAERELRTGALSGSAPQAVVRRTHPSAERSEDEGLQTRQISYCLATRAGFRRTGPDDKTGSDGLVDALTSQSMRTADDATHDTTATLRIVRSAKTCMVIVTR